MGHVARRERAAVSIRRPGSACPRSADLDRRDADRRGAGRAWAALLALGLPRLHPGHDADAMGGCGARARRHLPALLPARRRRAALLGAPAPLRDQPVCAARDQRRRRGPARRGLPWCERARRSWIGRSVSRSEGPHPPPRRAVHGPRGVGRARAEELHARGARARARSPPRSARTRSAGRGSRPRVVAAASAGDGDGLLAEGRRRDRVAIKART